LEWNSGGGNGPQLNTEVRMEGSTWIFVQGTPNVCSYATAGGAGMLT